MNLRIWPVFLSLLLASLAVDAFAQDGLQQKLAACAAIADEAARLECFTSVAASSGKPRITRRQLIERACGSERGCFRHGIEYLQMDPVANILDVLASACTKARGDDRTACYVKGLEEYPGLGDKDLLTGNRSGESADDLRQRAEALAAECSGRDVACYLAGFEQMGARFP